MLAKKQGIDQFIKAPNILHIRTTQLENQAIPKQYTHPLLSTPNLLQTQQDTSESMCAYKNFSSNLHSLKVVLKHMSDKSPITNMVSNGYLDTCSKGYLDTCQIFLHWLRRENEIDFNGEKV